MDEANNYLSKTFAGKYEDLRKYDKMAMEAKREIFERLFITKEALPSQKDLNLLVESRVLQTFIPQDGIPYVVPGASIYENTTPTVPTTNIEFIKKQAETMEPYFNNFKKIAQDSNIDITGSRAAADKIRKILSASEAEIQENLTKIESKPFNIGGIIALTGSLAIEAAQKELNEKETLGTKIDGKIIDLNQEFPPEKDLRV